MAGEPFHYRARKWALQQVTPLLHSPTQHKRLNTTDWDVLLILDACRYDILRDVGVWPVQREISPGSSTSDWLESSIESGIMDDAIIVTATPKHRQHGIDERVDEFVDLSESRLDSGLETVLPETILERVDDAVEGSTPVVGHLDQPHAPYIHRVGETWLDGLGSRWKEREYASTQAAMTRGDIDPNRAREAYRASVTSVCEVLEPFIERWVREGSHVVVTSDHGEVFGERRNFGMVEHPGRVRLPDLVHVPYVEFVPVEDADHEPRDALAALGYVSDA